MNADVALTNTLVIVGLPVLFAGGQHVHTEVLMADAHEVCAADSHNPVDCPESHPDCAETRAEHLAVAEAVEQTFELDWLGCSEQREEYVDYYVPALSGCYNLKHYFQIDHNKDLLAAG